MKLSEAIGMYETRVEGMTNYLDGKDPHSFYSYYSVEQVSGMVIEAKNALAVMREVSV